MKCWMTRLRARCECGCKFESFVLPPEEARGKEIVRTRSGFAAFLLADGAMSTELQECLEAPATPRELARLAARLGDPAPDGQAYETDLGPVCPRCGRTSVQLLVDKQLPEIVLALPTVTHSRWLALSPEERRAAVSAAAQAALPVS